jgi:hypothetical protein
MAISMHRASVPVFIRGLGVLSLLIDRAEAFAVAKNCEAAVLVGARLAPDMLPFSGQIQRASDTAVPRKRRLPSSGGRGIRPDQHE